MNFSVYWDQAKFQKSTPYNLSTNVQILYTVASSRAYRAFAAAFEAMEAPFFQWERVLQFPGSGCTVKKPKLVPEEFVAEENINYRKNVFASEGANADNRTVKMAILLLPPLREEPSRCDNQRPSYAWDCLIKLRALV
jgi:hypothetical protein